MRVALPRAPELLACLALGACTASGDRPGAERLLPRGRLVEELRIDGTRENLVPINGVGVGGDGSIAINQTQDRTIRFYTARGEALGAFGRRGQGPGEFERVTRIGWVGDSLWALDGRAGRVTLISPERTYVRSWQLLDGAEPGPDLAGRLPRYRFVYPRAYYGDRSILATAGTARGEATPAGYDELALPVLRIDSGGVIRKLLTLLPDDRGSLMYTTATSSGSAGIPFAARRLESFALDGRWVVFATTDIDGPHANTFLVTMIDAEGDTVFSRRHPFAPVPIPRSVAESVIEAGVARAPNPEFAGLYRQMKIPPVYPPLDGLLVGRDGTVWVGLRATGAAGHPWLVLDRGGAVLDTIVIPRNAYPAVAELGMLWTVESDENDVESVVRYRIERR